MVAVCQPRLQALAGLRRCIGPRHPNEVEAQRPGSIRKSALEGFSF
jgi:hypothetical protein